MKTGQISVVMPIYNGGTTLERVFKGLEMQKQKKLVDKLIIIDDSSSDNSKALIGSYAKDSSYKVETIYRNSCGGLSNGYNQGTLLVRSPYIITMHQDMELVDDSSFAKMLAPFDDPKVVATYPVVLHPYEVWKEYNFWQKCLFSRFVGHEIPMLTGKFDCFSVVYLKQVGLFDSKTYRTAGEDSDLKIKIAQDGRETANSGVRVAHLQYVSNDFGLDKLIRKEAQLAEAQGVILRKYGFRSVKDVLLSYFRQGLLLALLVPWANRAVFVVMIIYSIMYTRLVYQHEYANPRILILPFINIGLLFVALWYSLRGFINRRQTI